MKLKLLDENESVYGYYDGDVSGGNIPNGAGSLIYNDGWSFDGFFVEGKKRGYGAEFMNDTLLYRGEWFENEIHGCGYRKFDDAEYVGYFVNGLPHGFGVYFYNDGDIYVGEHKQGHLHGKGTFIYTDGTRLEGWWYDGKRQGPFFEITGDRILKGIYSDDKCRESRYVTYEDRLLNDPSGIYGRIEKNGKTYYGKYLTIESDYGYDLSLSGMALMYEGVDDWDVSVYENDVRQGESVCFFVDNISGECFERRFYVDGEIEGLYISYDDGEVTCQFPDGKYDDCDIERFYGIKYGSGDLYVGYFCGDAPRGEGLYYSSEDKILRAVEMHFGEEISRDDFFTTDDIFGRCFSLPRATLPGYAIDANENHFLAGETSYSFLTDELTIKPEGCISFNRATKEFKFTSRDGTRSYSSTASGERRYFVKDKLTWFVSDDGDYSIIQTKSDSKTLVRKDRNLLHMATYDLDSDLESNLESDIDTNPKIEPLYFLDEINGSFSAYIESEHKSDSIVWPQMAYYGYTENNKPFGYGQMIFPGIGFAMGRWSGMSNCDDATFFSYETQENVIVTITDGVITFPDGKTIVFA